MIFHADCLDQLRSMAENSLDSLVTDPPAGIAFMGKDWDKDKGGRDSWVAWMTEVMRECLRVLKPGAHGLVWALPRTSHWTATALENAGFEVRDVVTHLFGTGFPKSLDVSKAIDKAAGADREIISKSPSKYKVKGLSTDGSNDGYKRPSHDNWERDSSGYRMDIITAPATDSAKQWQGWGTALKPASEHWILVRKPISEKTVAANVLKWGVGGINIDGCRIGNEKIQGGRAGRKDISSFNVCIGEKPEPHTGRFPANLILDEQAAEMLDEQSGLSFGNGKRTAKKKNSMGFQGGEKSYDDFSYPDSGGASRFFYVAKASKSDRGPDNKHPTVKSTALMRYLIRLVTPPGGTVLDPFMGSGSTGVAAKAEGMEFVGIEREAEYIEIASNRLASCQ